MLAIIDVTKGKIVAKVITTGCGATLALTPDGKTAVADNPCNDSVVLVSLRSRKVRASVPLTGLSNPTGLALDSTGKTAYVVGNGGMAIVDIQHARQIAGVPLPGGSCWQTPLPASPLPRDSGVPTRQRAIKPRMRRW